MHSYLDRVQDHLLKKYPGLRFDIMEQGDNEAVVYFSGASEEEEYDVILRAARLSTDALVKHGYRIHVRPSPTVPAASANGY